MEQQVDDMSSTAEQLLNDVTEEVAVEANSVIANEQLMMADEGDDDSGCADGITSIDVIVSEIQRLQAEHALLKEKLSNVRFSEQWFENQDGKVEYYTGMLSFKVLQSIFGFVKDYIPTEESASNLPPFQQFVMTLMRLKLGLDPQDLALQFMTSVSTVLDTFEIVIHVLYMRLQCLIPEMPERDVFWMPDVSRKPLGFGQKIAVIVDCFEIPIDTPELEEACKQSWSDTELTHTVKCLVGFTPEGCIVFVSETFVGGAPNWSILEDCGILNKMEAGDIVLAGCSRCSQCSSMFCVKVDKMFNKDGTPQLTEDGEEKSEITVIEGEARSSLQVLKPHAEKLNGYVREKFLILKKRIPLDFLSNEDGEKPILDKILTVVCGLCNLYESPTNKL